MKDDLITKKLLTEKQVEEWFNISVSTLQKMRSRNGRDPIPFTKVGGSAPLPVFGPPLWRSVVRL